MRHELQNESQKTANFRVENEKMNFISSSLEINPYITRMLYNNHLVSVWVCCALALTTYILILTLAFTFIFIIIVTVIVMVITSATTLLSMRMGQGATCGLFIALFIQSESVSVHATVIYVIFQKCLCISHFYHAVCAPAAVVVVVACGTCLSCTPHFTRIDANKRPKRAKIKTERERERERTRQENCELHFKWFMWAWSQQQQQQKQQFYETKSFIIESALTMTMWVCEWMLWGSWQSIYVRHAPVSGELSIALAVTIVIYCYRNVIKSKKSIVLVRWNKYADIDIDNTRYRYRFR